MATPRVMHAGARMADGRVLVAGGTSSLADQTTAITSTLNTAEIWNPATGTWSAAPMIGGRRLAPALTLLPNGRVMVSGGVEVTLFFGVPINAVSTTAVQLYNPATNAWAAGTAMPAGRAGHHYNQVTLADGRVLMTGGVLVPSLLGAANAAPIANADLYNPTTGSWSGTLLANARSLHAANRLPDGRVVVTGGAQGTLTAPSSIAGVEVFSPTTNNWTSVAPLAAPRSGHVGFVQPDGLLLVFGGQDAAATTATIETLHF
jgi:N-acetylneuraminic acid mutarotase